MPLKNRPGEDEKLFMPSLEGLSDDEAIPVFIAELEKIRDRDSAETFPGSGKTIDGLIEEIRNRTPDGLEMLRLRRQGERDAIKRLEDRRKGNPSLPADPRRRDGRPSVSSEIVTAAGLALFVSSAVMGAYNSFRSEVDYNNRDGNVEKASRQAEPATSAVGALLGVDMHDECRPISIASSATVIDRQTGTKDVQYAITNTVVCDERTVRDSGSPNQKFHSPETLKESIAADASNTVGGILGLNIAALGAIAMVRSGRRRRGS